MNETHTRARLPGRAVLLLVCVLAVGSALAAPKKACFFERALINQMREAVKTSYAEPRNEAVTAIEQRAEARNNGPLAELMLRTNADPRRGAFLAFQGNGFGAASMLAALAPVGDTGFDIFIRDYRGLGRSGGEASLVATIDDVRAQVYHVRNDPRYAADTIVYYGTSFGGIVLLLALDEIQPREIVVLDGVPDLIPWPLFCKTEYSPISAARALAKKEGAISGKIITLASENDPKVPPAAMSKLFAWTTEQGGKVSQISRLAHPFEAEDDAVQRIPVLLDLLNQASERAQKESP